MPTSLFLIFGTAFVIGLSGAVMPGPVLAVSISEATRRGARAGPLLVSGHAIVEIAIIVALVWGLSEVMKQNLVEGIIGVIGGLFLLMMSYPILRQSRRAAAPLEEANPQPVKHGRWLIINGALLSIANPYWFIWWATIGTTWVFWSLEVASITGVVVFFFGHILSDLGWYSAVTFVVARGKRFMSARVYQRLLLVCGVALIGLGVYFMVSGAMFLAEA